MSTSRPTRVKTSVQERALKRRTRPTRSTSGAAAACSAAAVRSATADEATSTSIDRTSAAATGTTAERPTSGGSESVLARYSAAGEHLHSVSVNGDAGYQGSPASPPATCSSSANSARLSPLASSS